MQELFYSPLEKLSVDRPISRIPYLEQAVRNKHVLDIGAFDETAYNSKRDTDFWLHRNLASVATYVLGVDASPLIPVEGLETSKNSKILRATFSDLTTICNEYPCDIVVAGEIIEHLSATLDELITLKKVPQLSGKTLLMTTPNTTAAYNFILGLSKRESMHEDHLQIYSFKTLNTLCRRVGFQSWQIRPYFSAFPEMKLSGSRSVRIAATLFEGLVNVTEYLFPLLSGGWIVEARI